VQLLGPEIRGLRQFCEMGDRGEAKTSAKIIFSSTERVQHTLFSRRIGQGKDCTLTVLLKGDVTRRHRAQGPPGVTLS
jgi:hypothetical protein